MSEPEQENILWIKDIRWSRGGLEKLVVFLRGNETVEEWRPVTGGEQRAGALPSRNGGCVDWQAVDWDKTNIVIAAEVGVSSVTVANYRVRYGHRRRPFMTGDVDWEKVDWTQSNGQIAGALGVSISHVLQARQYYGKPAYAMDRDSQRQRSHKNIRVSQEQIDAADWVNSTDVMLARQWGVSRERVRQFRLEQQKPACRFEHMEEETIKALLWLEEHRAEIEGKHFTEAAKLIPGEFGMARRHRLLDLSGIPLDRQRSSVGRNQRYNFALSNLWLAKIWVVKHNQIGSLRSRYLLGKPKWQAHGFARKYASDPAFREAVKLEIEKAKQAGVPVPEQEIWQQINQVSERNK